MKNLNEIINNNIVEAKRDIIFQEIQGDTSKGAAYSTIDTSYGASKYKYGFIELNKNEEFVALDAFNTVQELEELLSIDYSVYPKLLLMKPQEYKKIGDSLFIRLW